MVLKSGIKFFSVVLVIVLLSYVALYGFNQLWGVNIPSVKDSVRLGLDLQGGVYIVYQADTDKPVTAGEMASAVEVIRRRLDAKNYNDANVTSDLANKRLVVEIPAVQDGDEAVREIGQVAKLTFREPDAEGHPIPEGKIILDGQDIKTATALYGLLQEGGNHEDYVQLELKPEGAEKFSDATERLIGKPIAIYLDDSLQSAPFVGSKIPGGTAIISGQFTAETAGSLAALIRSGALPFSLKPIQVEEIGPTLGQKALSVSLSAGAVALLLIMIFMLIYYRLPGIMADIALIAYVIITALVMSFTKITLTLPGIAGLILSMGMAVDANIIIFERIKEEMATGKTSRGAINAGFKRAFSAIFDSNTTTIIAGGVLWWLGTGPIQGFGKVLVIGVIVSMFMALTLTRFLLEQFTGFIPNLGKHGWLYGAVFKGGKAE